jgi:DNA ligase-associated metallophosphoesterase
MAAGSAARATGDRMPDGSNLITLGGAAFLADPSGALWCAATRTLVVADLHFEKGSAFAVRGQMLPPYDTRDTLFRLAEAVARYSPRTVIALGDSWHNTPGQARMTRDDSAALARLQTGRRWVWITGNHDPSIDSSLGGEHMEELTLGSLMLRHQPSERAGGCEIVGHYHPAAKVAVQGRALRRRCFVHDDRRLVLPAFGAFTGGLNVLDAAYDVVIERSRMRVLALGETGVYPVHTTLLRPD